MDWNVSQLKSLDFGVIDVRLRPISLSTVLDKYKF